MQPMFVKKSAPAVNKMLERTLHKGARLHNETLKKTFGFAIPGHMQQPLIHLIVNDLSGKGVCTSIEISVAKTNLIMDKNFQ